MKLVITLIICSLIGYFVANSKKSYNDTAQNRQNVTNAIKASSSPVPNTIEAQIQQTLIKVAADILRQVDVNKDGQCNCIDAAVLFYKYFPDKSAVCIEWNYNEKTDINHMFNCVLMYGYWRAIEPQTVYTGGSSFYMKDAWGAQYDSSLNKDVTAYWSQFSK